jgi:quercetin dioxygenase-like cupin family protein
MQVRIYSPDNAARFEPPGHFGGLEVSDVVARRVGESFSVQLSYCPPGGGGRVHAHETDAQLFLLVEGSLTFETNGRRFTLGPGEGVLFEPGEPHATINESEASSVSVVVTAARGEAA